jgi:hypothetical protein
MSKNQYWISDPNGGALALVEGVEERKTWTQVHGWDESDGPVSGDMVWAYNAEADVHGKLPHDTLGEGGYYRGVGWVPSAPPAPVDVTKDPALRDQPAPGRAATTSSTTTPVATGATTKEK